MDFDIEQTQKRLLQIAGIIGALGVALGAFGSHGLSSLLEANGRTGTFDTAVQYHLIHAVVLLVVSLLISKAQFHPAYLRSALFFVAGIVLFSGSLYILAIFNLGFMGAIAPIGGTSLILGWSSIVWGAYKS